MAELHRREIDSDGPVTISSGSPFADLPAGFVHSPLPNWNNQANLLRKWDEICWEKEPAGRVLPPDESLRSKHRAAMRVEFGLVIENQLLLVYCQTKIVQNLQVLLRVFVH